MDDLQFYPTPAALGARMIAKFHGDIFDENARIIEPSAGNGDLVQALVAQKRSSHRARLERHRSYWKCEEVAIDFIEIDMRKHAMLKSIDGVRGDVIGLDFLRFSGSLAAYRFVLMNPPFNAGAHHVLKALIDNDCGYFVWLAHRDA